MDKDHKRDVKEIFRIKKCLPTKLSFDILPFVQCSSSVEQPGLTLTDTNLVNFVPCVNPDYQRTLLGTS